MELPPFQAWLDEHAASLHRYLVASLGVHDAGDCFQETMLSALRAYPSLRNHDNLGGWLFTIAHRKVIDQARGRARRAIPIAEVPEPSVTTSGEPQLADGELWAAVSALPSKQRAAVLLRHAADRPYDEIGLVLGCTEAAARQNVRAGLARLREEIAS
ncbi:MAG: RNA polymerase sigma factor [Acidimicrobiales bacterium]